MVFIFSNSLCENIKYLNPNHHDQPGHTLVDNCRFRCNSLCKEFPTEPLLHPTINHYSYLLRYEKSIFFQPKCFVLPRLIHNLEKLLFWDLWANPKSHWD